MSAFSFTISVVHLLYIVTQSVLLCYTVIYSHAGLIYDELKRLPHSERNDPVLTMKQVQFVKECETSVKRLIRLVKYWRKKEVPAGRYYPSSYPFELLTIHAWEKAGSPGAFYTVQGFCQVLKYLVEYSEIKVMWTPERFVDQSLLRER